MGKTGFVDQKVAARFGRVRALVLAERGRFAVQGTVVAGWRVYGGRRLGPKPAARAPVLPDQPSALKISEGVLKSG
jgi:hypothetical protein